MRNAKPSVTGVQNESISYCLHHLLTLFPMGVGHECFFEEQIIIMLMQMDICSCELNDNSVLSILKARRALVSHFVIEN